MASELMRAISGVNTDLNNTAEIVERIIDPAEKRRYRAAISELMADVYIKFMTPIIDEHKDLDPDKSHP
ncbi:MAG: hypothetical protein GC201_00145 [Alphaproteobacteria bacterium]|nr:hypothetical protein [Alphaproteobacteria bacterium]